MIQEQLDKLKLPDLLTFADGEPVRTREDWEKRRKEVVEALCREIYGESPAAPREVRSCVVREGHTYCGKAMEYQVKVSFDTPSGEFSFPYYLLVPQGAAHPLMLHLAFRENVPDSYVPAEEIIDHGFALAVLCYNDVTKDAKDDFSSGLAPLFGERNTDSWGKIAMWAYGASRVLDDLYHRHLPEIDLDHVAVMGHSRLGKTALLTGALDERFRYVISNDSGCSGASLVRARVLEPDSESIAFITRELGYWFCGNYSQYAQCETDLPIDQHFLLAAVAPRYLYIASASEDKWANPKGEFLGCAAASRVWKLFGKSGLKTPDRYPEPGETLPDGEIGYHLRPGSHFLSRYDWNAYMRFIEMKMGRT